MGAANPSRGGQPARTISALHRYTAYGLGIHSEIPLPGFVAGTDRRDVEVRLESLDEAMEDLRGSHEEFSVRPGESRFWWDEIGGFVVRDGREILVDPVPGAVEEDLRIGVLGPALAALLQQRGFLLLHASAVVIDGVAVGFMGRSGWGKSTMAATLHAAGHALLADDVLAIRILHGIPHAFPGLVQYKLWPDAITALGGDPGEMQRLLGSSEKRWHSDAERFHTEVPVPLQNLYVLAPGERPEIEGLPAREAFLHLTSHSLAIRWFLKNTDSAHFLTRAQLVDAAAVRLLRRPRDLALLAELATLVERDVSSG